jgi:hypothetical protein
METTLNLTGIACIVAAIVGGGFKAFGIEIPMISSSTRQIILAALGLILILIANEKNLDSYISHESGSVPKLPELDSNIEKYNQLQDSIAAGHNIPKIEFLRDSTWKIIQAIVGQDTKGRKAVFDIGIISSKYCWALGSIDLKKISNILSPIRFKDYLKSSNFLARLKDSKGIICLGNASFENSTRSVLPTCSFKSSEPWPGGYYNGDEILRAEQRANVLANSINDLLDTAISIYTINLGYSIDINPYHSDSERSVVIIIIKKYEVQVELNEAVFRAILNLDGMPFNILQFNLSRNLSTFILKKKFN